MLSNSERPPSNHIQFGLLLPYTSHHYQQNPPTTRPQTISTPKTIGDLTVRMRTNTGEHTWERNAPRVFNTDGDLSIECEFIFLEDIFLSESVRVVPVVEGEGVQLAVELIGDLEYERRRIAVSICLFDPWVNLGMVQLATLDLPERNWLVGPVVYANGPTDHHCPNLVPPPNPT